LAGIANTVFSIARVLQYFLKINIGIGIGNTFFKVYWYWYCQYFLKVLLTTLQNLTHFLVTTGQHEFLTTVDFNIYLDNASDNLTYLSISHIFPPLS